MEKPFHAFCCYASKDELFLRDLKKHLMPLQREGLLAVQADIDISPGKERKREISYYLEKAQILLLLISADFIASNYLYEEEMRQAIALHLQGRARVVPVIVRPTDWQRTPFGKLQVLPKDAKPVSKWMDRDDAFLSIVEGIRTIVRELATDTRSTLERDGQSWPPAEEDCAQSRGQEESSTSTSKYHFDGPVHASVIGDYAHINNISNIYGKQKNGVHSLQRGSKALQDGDYPSAKKELRVAVDEIDTERQPREAAQARYSLTLALLEGMPPSTQGSFALEDIEEHLSSAIRLYPSASYLKALALLKKNVFLYISLKHRMQEVHKLLREAENSPWTDQDEKNFWLLRQCQPYLEYE